MTENMSAAALLVDVDTCISMQMVILNLALLSITLIPISTKKPFWKRCSLRSLCNIMIISLSRTICSVPAPCWITRIGWHRWFMLPAPILLIFLSLKMLIAYALNAIRSQTTGRKQPTASGKPVQPESVMLEMIIGKRRMLKLAFIIGNS